MIQICERFAESHSITFKPSKTKLLCFNMKLESKVPPIYLNGEKVSIVENEKHLGNYVSTDIEDRNIIADVCDLYQRSNLLISDFRACDSITLYSLHKIYCMHMYGSELWNLNCRYVDEFKVTWRKVKRRIWRLPSNTHNVIIQNLTYNQWCSGSGATGAIAPVPIFQGGAPLQFLFHLFLVNFDYILQKLAYYY